MTVEGVINAALRELRTLYGQEITQQPSDLILQIAGRRVFVTRRGVPLTQFNVKFKMNKKINFKFKYIRSCFENYRIPRLIIRQKKLIFNDYPPPPKIFEVKFKYLIKIEKKYIKWRKNYSGSMVCHTTTPSYFYSPNR